MSSRTSRTILSLVGVAAVAATAAVWAFARAGEPPVQTLRSVAAYPHDAEAFTQGLVIRDGTLYESTGLYGRSSVRRDDLKTGEVKKLAPLDERIFGEGCTVLGGELFLVTWQEKTGYVFDAGDLTFKRAFRYSGEGWGLTDDGKSLILSDGTAVLRFLDPKDAKVVKRLPVRDAGRPVEKLNELEFIDGEIYANIWYSDRIARISAETGEVGGWLDASPLRRGLALANPREDVLNGIAYDRDAKKLYLTGKRWPRLFEVEIVK